MFESKGKRQTMGSPGMINNEDYLQIMHSMANCLENVMIDK
jgi:hypothetical protein